MGHELLISLSRCSETIIISNLLSIIKSNSPRKTWKYATTPVGRGPNIIITFRAPLTLKPNYYDVPIIVIYSHFVPTGYIFLFHRMDKIY